MLWLQIAYLFPILFICENILGETYAIKSYYFCCWDKLFALIGSTFAVSLNSSPASFVSLQFQCPIPRSLIIGSNYEQQWSIPAGWVADNFPENPPSTGLIFVSVNLPSSSSPFREVCTYTAQRGGVHDLNSRV